MVVGEQPAGLGVVGPLGEDLLGPPGALLVVGVVEHPVARLRADSPGRWASRSAATATALRRSRSFRKRAAAACSARASSTRPSRVSARPRLFLTAHVVRVQGDRPVEKGQRGSPSRRGAWPRRPFLCAARRSWASSAIARLRWPIAAGLVAQLHQVPPGPQVRGGVVRLEGEIGVVLDRRPRRCGAPCAALRPGQGGRAQRRVAPQRLAVVNLDQALLISGPAVDLRPPEVRLGVVREVACPALRTAVGRGQVVGLEIDLRQRLVDLPVGRAVARRPVVSTGSASACRPSFAAIKA